MSAIRRTRFCVPLSLGMVTPIAAAATEVLSPARIGQTLVVLGAVVASIFALAYLARRVPGLAARAGGTMKLVDALSIGARERILLIEVDGERLVVAVAAGRIERLHVLAGATTPPPNFTAALSAAGAPQDGQS
jgi:flagellar protein FliO/FliZ